MHKHMAYFFAIKKTTGGTVVGINGGVDFK